MDHDSYKTWSRLGVGFAKSSSTKRFISLEETLLATCESGRKDSRLLFGMRAWLIKHHDLVNRSILIRLVKKADHTAVMGAMLDSVLDFHPRSGMKYVKKYCSPAKKPEFLFHRIAASSVQSQKNREENLKLWKPWKLISREMDDMSGAIAEKPFVLKHNKSLALRALFGPGIRAEILSYLFEHGQGNAYEISHKIGLSYEPVYSELQLCQEIGMMEAESVGKAIDFHLKPQWIRQILQPVI